MRKWISLLLVFLLAASLVIPAFATEGGSENPGGGDNSGGGTGGSDQPPAHTHSYVDGPSTATCTTAGTITSTCSCGDTTTKSAPATGHSASAWIPGAAGHTSTCTKCGAAMSDAHSWNSGTSTATCTEAGLKTYTCTVCSGTFSEVAPATGHTWGSVTSTATCTAAGKKTSVCSVCAHPETVDVPANGHTMSAWTQTGTTHSRTCTVSGCTYVESGNCAFVDVTTVTATCYRDGSKTPTCATCGYQKTAVAIPRLEHTYDNVCDPECNVAECKATRTPEHKFNKYYTYSSSAHWYACAKCKEIKDKEPHVPGPLPTEEKGQVCLDCGYEIMPKKGHTHEYDEKKWESDETGHWHECKDCGVEVEFDDHTFTGDCGTGCKVCGYVSKNGHIYDGTYESDKLSHWAICKVCDTASDPEAHTPGPEATAAKPQSCTTCGYELSVVQDHEHNFGPWITNDAEHWKQCECGEVQDQGVHAWDEGVKGKDKTITRTCIDCGETMTAVQTAKKSNTPMIIILVILILCFFATLGLLIFLIMKGRSGGKYS